MTSCKIPKVKKTTGTRTRLTRRMKEDLQKFSLTFEPDRTDLIEKTLAFQNTLVSLILEQYNQADMAVLHRYDCAKVPWRLKLVFSETSIGEFECLWDEQLWKGEVPLTTTNEWYPIVTIPHTGNHKTLFDAWYKASKAFNTDSTELYKVLDQMISQTNYVEDLIDLWPDCEAYLMDYVENPIPQHELTAKLNSLNVVKKAEKSKNNKC